MANRLFRTRQVFHRSAMLKFVEGVVATLETGLREFRQKNSQWRCGFLACTDLDVMSPVFKSRDPQFAVIGFWRPSRFRLGTTDRVAPAKDILSDEETFVFPILTDEERVFVGDWLAVWLSGQNIEATRSKELSRDGMQAYDLAVRDTEKFRIKSKVEKSRA